jgi:hypothetical protein
VIDGDITVGVPTCDELEAAIHVELVQDGS